MIPTGTSICGEIPVSGDSSFVLYLVAEEGREQISVHLTDCEDFYLGSIRRHELQELTAKLKLASLKQLNSILKNALQERKIIFNKEESTLTFCMKNSEITTDLPVTLQNLDQERKNKYLRALLCCMVQKIQEQEDISPPRNMSYISAVPSGARNKPAKLRPPGMSMIHPGTKRIRSESGVPAFNEEI